MSFSDVLDKWKKTSNSSSKDSFFKEFVSRKSSLSLLLSDELISSDELESSDELSEKLS